MSKEIGVAKCKLSFVVSTRIPLFVRVSKTCDKFTSNPSICWFITSTGISMFLMLGSVKLSVDRNWCQNSVDIKSHFLGFPFILVLEPAMLLSK
jgi:hypothetical protein